MPQEKTVLIVDPSPTDGRATGVILEHLSSGYKCEIMSTRTQASDCLARRTYDLIILDTDIQERLDGLKLAKLFMMRERNRSSKATTPLIILVSARFDQDTVKYGVSIGITDFIVKPFSPQTLLQRIEKSMQARESMEEEAFAKQFLTALKQISQLPTLSVVFAKVQSLLSAPDPSVDEVSRVIESDIAITLRVLRLANSAYFGFTKPVKTVKHAISLLGFQTIRNVVLAVSTFEALGKGTDSAGLDKPGLWKHAMGCGEIAAFLAKKRSFPEGDGFVGGLLHDVGKIVLDTFFTEYYTPVLEMVRSREIAIVDAEREVLGLSHEEVGMELASMWDLPADVAGIIGYHHRPAKAPENARLMATLVNVADALCRKLGIGKPGDDLVPVIDGTILESLKMNAALLDSWLAEIQERTEKSTAFLTALGES